MKSGPSCVVGPVLERRPVLTLLTQFPAPASELAKSALLMWRRGRIGFPVFVVPSGFGFGGFRARIYLLKRAASLGERPNKAQTVNISAKAEDRDA